MVVLIAILFVYVKKKFRLPMSFLGINEYAVNEHNALLVSPKNPQELAKAILRVLTDEPLAKRLAKSGLETAKEYTRDKAVDGVEEAFKNAL